MPFSSHTTLTSPRHESHPTRADHFPVSSTFTEYNEGIRSAEATQLTIVTTTTTPSSSTSILDWISHIPSPKQTCTTPQTFQDTPKPHPQKRRSQSLGSGPRLRKRRRTLQEMDYNMGTRGEGLDLVVTPKGSVVPSSSGSRNTSNVSPSKAARALK